MKGTDTANEARISLHSAVGDWTSEPVPRQPSRSVSQLLEHREEDSHSDSTNTMEERQHYPESEGLQLAPEQDGLQVHSGRPNRDSEGLQSMLSASSPGLVSPMSHGSTLRDSEGLQSVQGHSRGFSDGSATLEAAHPMGVKMHEKRAHQSWQPSGFAPAPIDASGGKSTATKKRRLLILGGAVAAVVVILVAVLGGVLGSRAHQNASSSPEAASQNASSQNAAVARRIQSPGAYNGTGFATFTDQIDLSKGYICFQDYKGVLSFASFNIENSTSKLALGRVQPMGLDAANGTAVAGYSMPKTAADPSSTEALTAGQSFHLAYIDSDGHLADAFQENAPSGSWVKGNLSNNRITAPTDNRPAMLFLEDSLGGINHGAASKLFAGATDGTVHQYSYDRNTKTWYPNATHKFDDSYAYGGAEGFVFQLPHTPKPGAPIYNLTLFLSNHNGSMQSYVQSDATDGANGSYWPENGRWSDSYKGGQQTLVNSSFALVLNQSSSGSTGSALDSEYQWMTYAGEKGVSQQHVIQSINDDDGHFGDADDEKLGGVRAMQGSDFNSFLMSGAQTLSTVVFYQPNGSSIGYTVFGQNGHDVKHTGAIVLDSNSQWVTT